MNRDPDREQRIGRHSLDYRVPRDRQLDSIEIDRPGPVTVVSDTLFPVECCFCEEKFMGPTESQSTGPFVDHMEEEHSNMPKQYELPQWFREMKADREADIIKLQYEIVDNVE